MAGLEAPCSGLSVDEKWCRAANFLQTRGAFTSARWGYGRQLAHVVLCGGLVMPSGCRWTGSQLARGRAAVWGAPVNQLQHGGAPLFSSDVQVVASSGGLSR